MADGCQCETNSIKNPFISSISTWSVRTGDSANHWPETETATATGTAVRVSVDRYDPVGLHWASLQRFESRPAPGSAGRTGKAQGPGSSPSQWGDDIKKCTATALVIKNVHVLDLEATVVQGCSESPCLQRWSWNAKIQSITFPPKSPYFVYLLCVWWCCFCRLMRSSNCKLRTRNSVIWSKMSTIWRRKCRYWVRVTYVRWCTSNQHSCCLSPDICL